MNLGILFFSVLVASSFFLPTLSDKCHKNERRTLLSIKSAMGNPSVIITWGDPKQTSDCCEWVGISCDKAGHVIALELSGGNISGPLPSSLSQLTKLDVLNLPSNQFSGSIPSSLGALQRLTFIALDHNKLTGPIPESIASIPNILHLILSDNSLSGAVPKAFSKTTSLIDVDLSRNNLSGDASVFFGKNKQLTSLDLSENMFEFDLSKVKLPKPEGKHFLDLNHNKIYGGIPSSFTEVFWTNFNVSYNRLCGKIPTGWGFDGFDATQFSHNRCLCGAPLPPCKSVSTNI